MTFTNRALYFLPGLAAVAPIFILFQLASIALYAAPETDDFCLASHFNADGLIGTLEIYYRTLMGRMVPLALITIPAAVAKATAVDYFTVYPLVLLIGMLIFVASMTFAVGRLWLNISMPERILIGTTLSAAAMVLAVSLREMLYWVSGSAPYMVPAIIAVMVLIELVRSSANDTNLRPATVCLLCALCFFGALCNEFTPLWLIAFISASLLFRAGRQAGSHVAMLASTAAGFAILLLSPGNALRMESYPTGGKLSESFVMASHFLGLDLWWLCDEAATQAWFAFLVIFSIFIAPRQASPAKRVLLLAGGIVLLVIGCAYAAYFVAFFATGEDLATRGRNEVIVLLLVGISCAVAMIGRIFRVLPRWHVRVVALIGCAAMSVFLFNGRALVAVNRERPQFVAFWKETMERHALLQTSAAPAVVVSERSVKPSVLMSADLTGDPTRMPNDCVAAFYSKTSVIAHQAD
ncbi:hypothetical protein IVB03_39570 [Bradyrhizobium sp. 168]|uniref:DUF6056 family protein n=1 Tax=Bradyrhizobium sp. 168 TaxID=2782639 RepID=UPI001FF9061C|nr:DUF6056 family protein [Bradyrhizobium sp. 168]MCK1585496.1 hypothetical protein [Bradyrhizobium sp. 168]